MAAKRYCWREEVVKEAVEAFEGPFTAAQLWQRCQDLNGKVSRATLYRIVGKLREESFIKDIVLPHGLHLSVRTDAEGCCVTECEDCGSFRMCAEFADQVTRAATKTPVVPSHAAVYLRGRCREWLNEGECKYHPETRVGRGTESDEGLVSAGSTLG